MSQKVSKATKQKVFIFYYLFDYIHLNIHLTAMELKVATVLDALTNGTVDAEPILLSFLHGLLPQRH